VPQTPEDYAQRLGRPGRPDAPGNMFTLMSTEEQKDLVGIERLLGRTIERSFLPAFDYGMRPSEIKQVLSYDDEWTRPKRPAGGLQSAAARIAGGPAARVPTTLRNPAPPAPSIPSRSALTSMAPAPPLRTLAPSPPKKPAATPGRPWLSPPKPSPSSHAKHPAGTKRPLSGAAKKSAAAKKAGVAAQRHGKPARHPAKKEPPPSQKRRR